MKRYRRDRVAAVAVLVGLIAAASVLAFLLTYDALQTLQP